MSFGVTDRQTDTSTYYTLLFASGVKSETIRCDIYKYTYIKYRYYLSYITTIFLRDYGNVLIALALST